MPYETTSLCGLQHAYGVATRGENWGGVFSKGFPSRKPAAPTSHCQGPSSWAPRMARQGPGGFFGRFSGVFFWGGVDVCFLALLVQCVGCWVGRGDLRSCSRTARTVRSLDFMFVFWLASPELSRVPRFAVFATSKCL